MTHNTYFGYVYQRERYRAYNFLAVASFVFAFGAPLYIGGAIYEKLNNEN